MATGFITLERTERGHYRESDGRRWTTEELRAALRAVRGTRIERHTAGEKRYLVIR